MPTAHYFELEKPTETESRAMRMGASLSTLPSQQECNAQTQVPTVTYDELTGPGHTKKSNSSKASAASLPLQYSSIEKVCDYIYHSWSYSKATCNIKGTIIHDLFVVTNSCCAKVDETLLRENCLSI